MTLTGSIVLGTYISLQNPIGFVDPEQQAYRHIAKASYMEFEIDKTVKRLEKRYVPKWIYKYGPYVGPVIQIVAQNRLSYTWRF